MRAHLSRGTTNHTDSKTALPPNNVQNSTVRPAMPKRPTDSTKANPIPAQTSTANDRKAPFTNWFR